MLKDRSATIPGGGGLQGSSNSSVNHKDELYENSIQDSLYDSQLHASISQQELNNRRSSLPSLKDGKTDKSGHQVSKKQLQPMQVSDAPFPKLKKGSLTERGGFYRRPQEFGTYNTNMKGQLKTIYRMPPRKVREVASPK